jgi:hypothetical protein
VAIQRLNICSYQQTVQERSQREERNDEGKEIKGEEKIRKRRSNGRYKC